jgi:Concanavalin A-like lectin/glucanases superfamily
MFLVAPYRFTAAPPAGDPLFASNSLLMHMDGTDGSTTFTDVIGNTITRAGGAVLSTTQFKFGTASFRGNASSYLTIPHSTALDLVTGDWTIEFWVRLDNVGVNHMFINKGLGTGFYPWQLYFDSLTGKFVFRAFDNVGPSLIFSMAQTTSGPAANTWYHVAGVRDGNTFRFFVDGADAGTFTSSATLFTSTASISIGAYDNGIAAFQGYLDELRITKGVARYTAPFTPSASPFPDSV